MGLMTPNSPGATAKATRRIDDRHGTQQHVRDERFQVLRGRIGRGGRARETFHEGFESS